MELDYSKYTLQSNTDMTNLANAIRARAGLSSTDKLNTAEMIEAFNRFNLYVWELSMLNDIKSSAFDINDCSLQSVEDLQTISQLIAKASEELSGRKLSVAQMAYILNNNSSYYIVTNTFRFRAVAECCDEAIYSGEDFSIKCSLNGSEVSTQDITFDIGFSGNRQIDFSDDIHMNITSMYLNEYWSNTYMCYCNQAVFEGTIEIADWSDSTFAFDFTSNNNLSTNNFTGRLDLAMWGPYEVIQDLKYDEEIPTLSVPFTIYNMYDEWEYGLGDTYCLWLGHAEPDYATITLGDIGYDATLDESNNISISDVSCTHIGNTSDGKCVVVVTGWLHAPAGFGNFKLYMGGGPGYDSITPSNYYYSNVLNATSMSSELSVQQLDIPDVVDELQRYSLTGDTPTGYVYTSSSSYDNLTYDLYVNDYVVSGGPVNYHNYTTAEFPGYSCTVYIRLELVYDYINNTSEQGYLTRVSGYIEVPSGQQHRYRIGNIFVNGVEITVNID